MAPWRDLPQELEPQVRQLVVFLRGLKDRTGLTQEKLAQRTPYSTSSWGRWLNGEGLPPRQAVEALGQMAELDRVNLMRLVEHWKVAEQVYRCRGSGEAEPPVSASPESGETPAQQPFAGTADEEGERKTQFWRRRGIVAVTLCVALLAVFGVLAMAQPPWLPEALGGSPSASPTTTSVPTASQTAYPCRYSTHDGKRYAGYSKTATKMLEVTSAEAAVVEAQCLLQYHGYSPGPIDGVYGERTQVAVKELQRGAGLDVDGVIGPNTWKVLRR